MSTTENHLSPTGDAAALDVRDLEVTFHRRGRRLPVLKGVTLKIERGEAYGLVGESGCATSPRTAHSTTGACWSTARTSAS
jgi:ABC-type glutathione transport system ATPase component